jgi:hypothetical protein
VYAVEPKEKQKRLRTKLGPPAPVYVSAMTLVTGPTSDVISVALSPIGLVD